MNRIIKALSILLCFILCSCSYKNYYNEIDDYGSIWALEGVFYDVQAENTVFPSTIYGLDVRQFMCRHDQELPLGEAMQVLLSVHYEDTNKFDKELERLNSLAIDGYNENFQSTVYVENFAKDFYYAYALVDENEQIITYVYLLGLKRSSIEFDSKYLPDNYIDYGIE